MPNFTDQQKAANEKLKLFQAQPNQEAFNQFSLNLDPLINRLHVEAKNELRDLFTAFDTIKIYKYSSGLRESIKKHSAYILNILTTEALAHQIEAVIPLLLRLSPVWFQEKLKDEEYTEIETRLKALRSDNVTEGIILDKLEIFPTSGNVDNNSLITCIKPPFWDSVHSEDEENFSSNPAKVLLAEHEERNKGNNYELQGLSIL